MSLSAGDSQVSTNPRSLFIMAAMPIDEEKNPGIDHDEGYGVIAANRKTVNEAGRLATIAEHDLTFRQAVRAYPRAIFWSVLVSTCIIMEGYDVVLVGSMFGPACLPEEIWQLLSRPQRIPAVWPLDGCLG
jgi:hypothetical protein